ncbi:hypothetical protein ACIQNU_02505 [Streptomyces sp. NPDC091292]|uniref:hypothetical protein n=1 Tax=Streptomyces sp. NPDC091292 TaxID=3365991 RepID=UPI0037F77283
MKLPDHGTYSRYHGGCRCKECCDAGRSYRLRLSYDRINGVARRVDATQVRVHLERLIARGWTQYQIAAAASLHQATVSVVLGGSPMVYRKTASAILGIRLDQAPPVPRGMVDGAGTRRRLQALMVLGHSLADVARRAGAPPSSLQQTADGRWTTIRAATATSVARVYRQLSTSPAPPTRAAEQARNHAQAHGWHGPMAWADIDDPACIPDPDSPSAPRHLHAADVAELVTQGLDDDAIGRRLGVSSRTVLRARAAHGIPSARSAA